MERFDDAPHGGRMRRGVRPSGSSVVEPLDGPTAPGSESPARDVAAIRRRHRPSSTRAGPSGWRSRCHRSSASARRRTSSGRDSDPEDSRFPQRPGIMVPCSRPVRLSAAAPSSPIKHVDGEAAIPKAFTSPTAAFASAADEKSAVTRFRGTNTYPVPVRVRVDVGHASYPPVEPVERKRLRVRRVPRHPSRRPLARLENSCRLRRRPRDVG